MTTTRKRRTIDYKTLEGRRLLAGNVTVFENVHLYIRGDADDNQFEVVVENDNLMINGLDGTTINGQDSYLVAGASVTDSGVSFAGGLRAHLGPGHDELDIMDAQFEQMSIVYGGTGNDSIDVIDSMFAERTVLQTFDGDDSISTSRSHFGDSFYAATLNGNDSVSMNETVFTGRSITITGEGNDSLASMNSSYMGDVNLMLTLGGNDQVELQNPTVGTSQLGIFLGNGDDMIEGDMSNAQIEGSVRIGGQAGMDRIDMEMTDGVQANVTMGTFEATGEVVFGQLGFNSAALFTTDSIPGEVDSLQAFAERVSFAEDTNVYSIAFEGSFQNFDPEFDPSNPTEFIVRVYGNNMGEEELLTNISGETGIFTFNQPSDELIYDLELTVGKGNQVATGTTTPSAIHGEERQVYQFDFDVDMEFAAGESYWVSIYRKRPELTETNSDEYRNSFYLNYGLSETERLNAIYYNNGWEKAFVFPDRGPQFRGTAFELRS